MTFSFYVVNVFSEGGVKNCLQIFWSDLHSRNDPPPLKDVEHIDRERREHVGRALSSGYTRPTVKAENDSGRCENDPSRCGGK